MITDPAGELAKLITGAIKQQLTVLHVSFLCRVISYNLESCLAVVQPLIRSGDAEPAVIQNVPALCQRFMVGGIEQAFKPVLHPGDAVLVVCGDKEIKNALNGQIATASTERMHSLNDAVIVGVLSCSL